jgi:hypothetical protein
MSVRQSHLSVWRVSAKNGRSVTQGAVP